MTSQDIMLTVDYHDENCVVRRRDLATGKEAVRKVPTDCRTLRTVMTNAAQEAHARARADRRVRGGAGAGSAARRCRPEGPRREGP